MIVAKKSAITLAMTLIFILSTLSACSASSSNTATSSGAATSSDITEPSASGPEEYTLPLVNKETIVSFATADNLAGTVSYTDYLPAWQEFTARTGVKIDFQVVPDASYNENIQTRLAAGLNLPDIIKLPPNPVQYADSGVIIPIDELINSYAPNIVELFTEKPAVKAATTAPDGRIYYLSSILNARSVVNYQTMIYRKDWLEQSNVQELVTIDDWHAFLTYVMNNDANGNGDPNDEIPLTFERFSHLNVFAWAYGVKLETTDNNAEFENWQADDNGRVSFVWTDLRLKDWLATMNK